MFSYTSKGIKKHGKKGRVFHSFERVYAKKKQRPWKNEGVFVVAKLYMSKNIKKTTEKALVFMVSS